MTLQSLDELEKQINTQITQFDGRRQRTRRWKNVLLIAQVLFTALTTFLIAANTKYNSDILNISAVALNLSATVFGIFQALYMFHERLHTYTMTSASLQGVLARLKMHKLKHADDPIACPLDTSTVDQLFLEMQTILENSNGQWSKMMINNKPKATVNDQFKGTELR